VFSASAEMGIEHDTSWREKADIAAGRQWRVAALGYSSEPRARPTEQFATLGRNASLCCASCSNNSDRAPLGVLAAPSYRKRRKSRPFFNRQERGLVLGKVLFPDERDCGLQQSSASLMSLGKTGDGSRF